MRVLFVVSECAPLIKTGGLADVAGALPKALKALGHDVRILIPAYPSVHAAMPPDQTSLGLGMLIGGEGRIIMGQAGDLDLMALDIPHLFDRPGNPYLGPDGHDWPDNHVRYATLSLAGAKIAANGANGWRPDVVHAHDWQGGLTPAYMRFDATPTPPCIMTIHNIAFQGLFPADQLGALALPGAEFHAKGFEFYGRIGFLKAGLIYADRITTVSPSYARELTTPEYGMGLEGVIGDRRADLHGVLNGVDLDIWNPAKDEHIRQTYSANSQKGKAANRSALLDRFSLSGPRDGPVFCVISRLTRQKGLDLLLDVLPRLLARGATLAVLGAGDGDLETRFRAAAAEHPHRVGVVIGYDEELAHQLLAGADSILIPSRYEPCGLTQLYGLRYGTLPVVARTGGLADTIIDANDAALRAGVATGFQFSPPTVKTLGDAIDHACDIFEQPKLWKKMVRHAMKHPVGWGESAAVYDAIYRSLTVEA